MAKDLSSPNLFAFVERGGWFSADAFVSWLQAKLDAGQWQGTQRTFSKMTLSQFFAATKVELTVVASDTTGGRMLVLNHRTAPDCPLVMAVRMSMSIPLLWDEVIWQESWGTYRGRDISGHAIVDGGMLSNFPIELFVSQDATVKSVMGEDSGSSVLGMLIDESMPVEGVDNKALVTGGFNLTELRTVQRLAGLMNTALTAHDKMVIDAFERLVARMPAKGFGTTEFNMTDERRECLVNAGRASMKAYFQRIEREGTSFGSEGDRQNFDRALQKADQTALKILSE